MLSFRVVVCYLCDHTPAVSQTALGARYTHWPAHLRACTLRTADRGLRLVHVYQHGAVWCEGHRYVHLRGGPLSRCRHPAQHLSDDPRERHPEGQAMIRGSEHTAR
jgi:hypothetical protein